MVVYEKEKEKVMRVEFSGDWRCEFLEEMGFCKNILNINNYK